MTCSHPLAPSQIEDGWKFERCYHVGEYAVIDHSTARGGRVLTRLGPGGFGGVEPIDAEDADEAWEWSCKQARQAADGVQV